MKYECAHHVHDCLNCTLRLSVLVLGTYSREKLLLILVFAVFPELLGSKDAVIAVILLDLNTSQLPKPLFKPTLGADCLKITQRYLVLDPNDARRGIVEYRTAMIAVRFALSTITSR